MKHPNLITIKCPKCKRTKRVKRLSFDPAGASVLSLLCDRCDTGGGFSESEPITPKLPSKAKVLAMFRRAPKVTRNQEAKLAKAVRRVLGTASADAGRGTL